MQYGTVGGLTESDEAEYLISPRSANRAVSLIAVGLRASILSYPFSDKQHEEPKKTLKLSPSTDTIMTAQSQTHPILLDE